jgi:arylsulfatase A-like enzyme
MNQKRLTRRKFLHASALATGALTLGKKNFALSAAKSTRNVIVIVSDTMRRDALGCCGGQWVRTPNLDAFAAKSIRCNKSFLCSFPTVPTRHDILTGRHTFTYKPWSPLDKDTITLQDVLRPAGIYTALIVDTPHPFRPDYNYQRNFDFVQINRGQEGDPYRTAPVPVQLPCDPKKLRDGDKVVTQYLRNVQDRKVEEDYFCARTLRGAADWLEKNHRRQPFFLYVDTFDPHEPWDPPKSYVEEYDPGYIGDEVIYPRYDRWKGFLSEKELKHCRSLYAGEASMVDHWAGRLLERIENLGLLESTLVIFLADHGFYLGEHGYIGKAFIRDNKFQSLPLYSEVCRVPFLVQYPNCKPGSVIDALVQPVHLAPTVLDYFDIKKPETFTAPSLWPVLQGKEEKVTDLAISSPTLSSLEMKQPQPTNRASITDGHWLLIYGCAGSGNSGDKTASVDGQQRLIAPLTGEKLAPMLFDLDADPNCLVDIIGKKSEVARDLHRRFFTFLQGSPMKRDHLSFFERI